MEVIILIVILTTVIFLIYRRKQKDAIMQLYLEKELNDYLLFFNAEKFRCSIKIYESDTIIPFSVIRNSYFFKKGILIFNGDSVDFGKEASSIWLYFSKEDEKLFKNCHSRGQISDISDNGSKVTIKAIQKTNYLPFFISRIEMKYEILTNGSVSNGAFDDF